MNDILTFDFDSISQSFENYNNVKEDLKTKIRNNYSIRNNDAKILLNKNEIDSTLGCVLVNLFIIRAFVESGISISENNLILKDGFTQDELNDKFNLILNKFKLESSIDYKKVRNNIAESLNEMATYSVDMEGMSGYSIGFRDFLRLASTDKEAYDIFNTKLDYGMQISEIEDTFKATTKRIKNMYLNHPESNLYPYLRSDVGVNAKQLTQCIGFVGMKPNIEGQVIPVVIDRNYLTGLNTLQNYYVNACGTRLAMIINKMMTKTGGYLTRKLSLLMIDTYHNNDLKDCGTRHYVVYDIDSDKKLNMINNRHYYEIDQTTLQRKSEELHTIDENDKSLIGKKIGLRSPITCCGDHVCATCYGKYLSEINKDLHTGLAAVFRLTEPLTQRMLSAKHLLQTNTDKIDWGDEFFEYFLINVQSVYFKGISCVVSFQAPTVDDYDEDKDLYTVSKLYISSSSAKKATEYNPPTKMYINPKFLSKSQLDSDDGIIKINSENVEDGEEIFSFEPKNNGLVKSLVQIIDLIETKDHLGCKTYHEIANKFADLLIENDLNYIPSVHLEMIVSQLIRDAKTNKKIKFDKDIVEPYEIFRVTKAVMSGPLSTSLAFERINNQLVDLETYRKDANSFMDYLFY